jgi:hypothetical protein
MLATIMATSPMSPMSHPSDLARFTLGHGRTEGSNPSLSASFIIP